MKKIVCRLKDDEELLVEAILQITFLREIFKKNFYFSWTSDDKLMLQVFN